MSIIAAFNGLVAEAIDRLADRISKTEAHQQATRSHLGEFLDDPGRAGGRALVARVARSEVKDYLQNLAEEAEVPFRSPVEFLRGMRSLVDEAIARQQAKDDAVFQTAEEAQQDLADPPPPPVERRSDRASRTGDPGRPGGDTYGMYGPLPVYRQTSVPPPDVSEEDNPDAWHLYRSVLSARGLTEEQNQALRANLNDLIATIPPEDKWVQDR